MKKLVFVSLIALIAFTGIASAQAPESRFFNDYGRKQADAAFWENERIVKALALTPQEISRLAELSAEHRAVVKDLREKIKAEREALRDVMEGENYSASSAQNHFTIAENLHTRLAQERFDFRLEQRDLLGQKRYLKLMDINRRAMEGQRNHRRFKM